MCVVQIERSVLGLSLPHCSFLSEFGRGSPGAPVAVMACSWLLWYRLGILALMMCKMSKRCLWHLQMAPPWPVLPNCSLIHRNGEHFFKWLPDACIRTTQHIPRRKTIAHLVSCTLSPFQPSVHANESNLDSSRWRAVCYVSSEGSSHQSPEGFRRLRQSRCCSLPYRQHSWARHQTPWGANLVHGLSAAHLLLLQRKKRNHRPQVSLSSIRFWSDF